MSYHFGNLRMSVSLKGLKIDEEEFYRHDLINCYGQVESTLSNILTSRNEDKVLKFVIYYCNRTKLFSL